jgi:hypothetical protein
MLGRLIAIHRTPEQKALPGPRIAKGTFDRFFIGWGLAYQTVLAKEARVAQLGSKETGNQAFLNSVVTIHGNAHAGALRVWRHYSTKRGGSCALWLARELRGI